MISLASELVQIVRPYYWVNILLSVSYIAAKRIPVVCSTLFAGGECELSARDTEVLLFLLVVVALRSRKAGSVTMLDYLTSAFLYTKIANLVLWFYADVTMGLIFGAVVVLCGLLLPQPTYQGPESVVYFRGLPSLQEQLDAPGDVTWLVCLYAAWHPACVSFAPVFSRLSNEFQLDNLRFGKLDVGRYPGAAARYGVQDGATSRQLPTLLLLQAGREAARRPHADSQGKLVKFVFSEENVKSHFNLPGLYKECQDKLKTKENKKQQ